MNTRRSILGLIGLSTVLAMTAAFDGLSTRQTARVGEAAPDFTLMNTSGEEVSLSDFEGKLVVLQWINPDCPVCDRVMTTGVVAQMREELKALNKDIVHLAINSTNYQDAKTTAAYLKENKFAKEVKGLVDTDGTVGHLYNARTTPHMYVIDTKGVLRYAGAIDDDASGRNADSATNYVVSAVTQITAGETVSPDSTRSYGCGVKY